LQQPANPQLDPAQIRQRLKRQSRRHLASAAVLLIAVGLGGFSGWQAREMTLARASVLPMTDALQAYRLIAQQGILPADYKVDSDGDMQHWLDGISLRPVAAGSEIRRLRTGQRPSAQHRRRSGGDGDV
jgi:hypothetical protein